MGKPGKVVALLLAAAGLIAVGYALGRGSGSAPADLPPAPAASAPAPAPPANPDPLAAEVEELRRDAARLQAENEALRAAREPRPDLLDRAALKDVGRQLDEVLAEDLEAEHPEFRPLVDEYERVRSDVVSAPEGPEREALLARVSELRDRITAVREPYRRAADHTRLLIESVGRKVGLTAGQMRRIGDFAYPRNRELEGLRAVVQDRIEALRKAHPEIERRAGWEDGGATARYRELDPDLDRALFRMKELVGDYHATWKGMLTGEQRARLDDLGR